MVFDKLYIQNFLSIKSITLSLDNRGMVLICGENLDNADFQSNGAGKSSLTEALAYVLYGRTIRGLRGDDVVNRVSKRNTKVVLDLVDDDGAKYRVARYRKHQAQGNKFFLYRDGRDITPKSEADFTQTITDLLQMDFFTFTSSILYSASSFKFTSATDAELKSAFDTLLGLDIWVNCQDEAKTQLRDAEAKYQNLSAKASMTKANVQQLQGEMEAAEAKAVEWEHTQHEKVDALYDEIADLEAEQKTLLGRKHQYMADVEDAKQGVYKAQAAVDKLKKTSDAVGQLQQKVRECNDMVNHHEREISRLGSRHRAAEGEIAQRNGFIARLKAKKEKLNAKLIETQETVGSPCPTCGAPLTESSIQAALDEITSELNDIQAEIDEHEEVIQEQRNEQSRLQAQEVELKQKIVEVEDDLATFNELLEKAERVTAKQQKQMEALSDAKVALNKAQSSVDKMESDIQMIDRQIRTIKKSIEAIKAEENPYEGVAQRYAEQIAQHQAEVDQMGKQMEALATDIACIQFWVKAYGNGGIKSLLLDDITPYLNRQANRYLHRLSSDHMEIRFSTQTALKNGEKREKFSIEVLNSDGGASYAANSSGEKKRVDLAINLALQSLVSSRSNKKLNILMLDEVLDALDATGIEHVMDLLQEIAQQKSSVFVISHNDDIKSVFTETITVVKKGGYTTLKDPAAVDEGETDGDT